LVIFHDFLAIFFMGVDFLKFSTKIPRKSHPAQSIN
jgi:hypothetical protein